MRLVEEKKTTSDCLVDACALTSAFNFQHCQLRQSA